MLVAEHRPRNLKWFHAGPMLFGDWGTSRLYVLGLAFYYTGHASPLYLGVMSVLMAAVAWAYTVICRCFPDGGGVYAAARQLSPTLSVIGAALLLCDYIVTAALSVVEGFHYFGSPASAVVALSITTILGIGVINWLGARNAGRFALAIAIAAIVVSGTIAAMCLPMLGQGLSTVSTGHPSIASPWVRWESLVRIVLALSGLEAVANMTGLMSHPVNRTARRTIWPVLAEVVILNAVFCVALNALPSLVGVHQPDYVTYEIQQGLPSEQVPEAVRAYRDTPMKLLAHHAGQNVLGEKAGAVLGTTASIVFGLLLISAVNTAIMAMVAVMYSLSRDRELPAPLARLNYSGVPWIALIIACALPIALLPLVSDPKRLGEMYAIGVVGAITLNVLSCASNRALKIGPWERRALWAIGGVMGAVELTIIAVKHEAAIFAAVMLVVVLACRHIARRRATALAERALPEPALGWLAELPAGPLQTAPGTPRIMLAARGREQAEFAVDMAKKRGAALFAIYVRTLRVIDVTPGQVPRLEDDKQAQEALGTVAVLARQARVPFAPIYVTSTDIASEILDYTVTFGCDTLIMGKSRRTFFARAVAGDVLASVARHLPDEVALITRSATPAEAHPGAPA